MLMACGSKAEIANEEIIVRRLIVSY